MPQWMKMPNLASWNQAGLGRLSRDFQVGSYRGAATAAAERHRHRRKVFMVKSHYITPRRRQCKLKLFVIHVGLVR